MKLLNRCNGRGNTADVCPISKEEVTMAVMTDAGAKGGDGDDGTVRASAFKAEGEGNRGDVFGRMGDEEWA